MSVVGVLELSNDKTGEQIETTRRYSHPLPREGELIRADGNQLFRVREVVHSPDEWRITLRVVPEDMGNG